MDLILAFTLGVIVGIILGLLVAGIAYGASRMTRDQTTGGTVPPPRPSTDDELKFRD